MQHQNKFMQEAIDLAKQNLKLKNGGPFGAVVVKDGKIIGRGVNSVTSQNDPTAHAEVNAIREACAVINSFQLDDCEIYSSCEPCPMCLGAIYWARSKKFYYAATREDAAKAGFDDSEIYKEIQLPIQSRKIPSEQLMEMEANQIFQTWIELEHKTEY
jgi:guanine deaminase